MSSLFIDRALGPVAYPRQCGERRALRTQAAGFVQDLTPSAGGSFGAHLLDLPLQASDCRGPGERNHAQHSSDSPAHVRFRESAGVRFPRATRPVILSLPDFPSCSGSGVRRRARRFAATAGPGPGRGSARGLLRTPTRPRSRSARKFFANLRCRGRSRPPPCGRT